MSAKQDTSGLDEPRITVDDLRHRAHVVKSLAVTEAKDTVDTVMGDAGTRTLVAVVGMVVVAASIAFYLGTRSARGGYDVE